MPWPKSAVASLRISASSTSAAGSFWPSTGGPATGPGWRYKGQPYCHSILMLWLFFFFLSGKTFCGAILGKYDFYKVLMELHCMGGILFGLETIILIYLGGWTLPVIFRGLWTGK